MIKKRGADFGSPFFLFNFYRQHCEVIALFGYAHECVDSICHVPDDLDWLKQTIGNHRFSDLLNAFITKLGMIDVLSFIQSIGKEEESSRSFKLNLLLLESELSYDADRQPKSNGES